MSSAPTHSALSAPRATHTRELRLVPAWSQPGTAFRHTWEQVTNVDQFRWMVRGDMQEQLALAQRELGVRHVRAVGMFDDELRVFRPSPASFMGYEPAVPRTNWQTVDYVIDALLERGLNPMFTTSFVPSALTSGPTTVFTTKGHTSPARRLARMGGAGERVGAARRRALRDRGRAWLVFRSLERAESAQLVLGWRQGAVLKALAGHAQCAEERRCVIARWRSIVRSCGVDRGPHALRRGARLSAGLSHGARLQQRRVDRRSARAVRWCAVRQEQPVAQLCARHHARRACAS